MRFRYGDGFSHARALGLRIALAAVPLVIAFVGLSRTLDTSLGHVLRQTILSLAPAGPGGLLRDTLVRPSLVGEDRDELALWLGLLTAILALTTAVGQLERSANRVYGVRRDRTALHKYGHALLMAVVAGIPRWSGRCSCWRSAPSAARSRKPTASTTTRCPRSGSRWESC